MGAVKFKVENTTCGGKGPGEHYHVDDPVTGERCELNPNQIRRVDW